MAEKSPAYLWYPRDIDSSGRVRSLTDLEELWYRRALDQSWMHEGIPKDPTLAAGWIGRNCTPESAEKILKMFFVCHKKDETKMVNPRQEEERKKLRQRSKLRAEAGRVSGVNRRARKNEKKNKEFSEKKHSENSTTQNGLQNNDLTAEQMLNKTRTKSNIPIPISIQDISYEISEEKEAISSPALSQEIFPERPFENPAVTLYQEILGLNVSTPFAVAIQKKVTPELYPIWHTLIQNKSAYGGKDRREREKVANWILDEFDDRVKKENGTNNTLTTEREKSGKRAVDNELFMQDLERRIANGDNPFVSDGDDENNIAGYLVS